MSPVLRDGADRYPALNSSNIVDGETISYQWNAELSISVSGATYLLTADDIGYTTVTDDKFW